jgi:tRNA 2-(methylsulfanyl)-N6-isopentenyladenosine37 hydroxylase
MEDRSTREDLPLLSRTPDDWAATVLRDPLALLSDHAYLEKKAAANALELLNRWPEPSPPEEWTQTLASIASDEASHLNNVVRLLTERGGRLERAHRNDYARQLRQNVRKGRGHEDLLDRLLVSALIELRSCERFEVLARYCEERDPVLSRFYRRLWSSEFGHYRVFLRLAERVVPPDVVEARWSEMLRIEAETIAAQAPGPRMHSGWASLSSSSSSSSGGGSS